MRRAKCQPALLKSASASDADGDLVESGLRTSERLQYGIEWRMSKHLRSVAELSGRNIRELAKLVDWICPMTSMP